ncbi:MAG: ATP phosphoribosyltransferase regulatory subunit [Chromatiales bacterium]|nr:ATP phosphoribosyltransferase regulatory subunit [Gammaproteobacteria bacterium]MBW6476878.1 ATP phosphoribosyltransferase regulatory subunit [Chromatiales bacterium]
MQNDRWLLPEGIEEILPPRAAQLETTLRRLLDLYQSWGYELVMPPFIEFLDSLLIGTGQDLDLHTFKLTDQMTGRLMGLRSDMTPQVARIDAHCLKRSVPTRLCYMGTVLRTLPATHGGNRSPMQVGAELYGHAGVESDIEVLRLMLETLHSAGIAQVYLDLGHVGIFRALASQAGLDAALETQLFDALQRKAKPEIASLLEELQLPAAQAEMLASLADLHGGQEVLARARVALAAGGEPIISCLDTLAAIAEAVDGMTGVSLHYDLAELRGYHYHTGAVFAAYVPGQGQAIAQGGRYDDIGKAFGVARPATGFSTDLKTVLAQVAAHTPALRGIFAPAGNDPAMQAAIAALRQQGERVIQALPGQQGAAREMGCDRELILRGKDWVLGPLAQT